MALTISGPLSIPSAAPDGGGGGARVPGTARGAPVRRRTSGSLASSGSDLLDALAPQRRRLSRRARARDPASRLARTADHFAAARGSRRSPRRKIRQWLSRGTIRSAGGGGIPSGVAQPPALE